MISMREPEEAHGQNKELHLEEERECGLCYDMEWDEAVYCPQCFGSGKVLSVRSEIQSGVLISEAGLVQR
jgi:hypothetical protein